MSPLTTFLSRLLGIFFVLTALSLAIHKQVILETITTLVHTAPLLLVAGMVAFLAGLAIVLAHNVWSGGVLPVLITLIGWATLIRGLILLLLPPEAVTGIFGIIHFERLFYFYILITLVIGAYLTYGGFRSHRKV